MNHLSGAVRRKTGWGWDISQGDGINKKQILNNMTKRFIIKFTFRLRLRKNNYYT